MGSFSLSRILTDHMKAVDIVIAVVGYIVCHYFLQRNLKVKGPRMWPLLGMLPSLLINTNRVYDWVTENLIRCGGTFTFSGPCMSSLFCVVTADPGNLAHMLRLRFCNFPKGDYFRSIAHDFLGDGIFNADAETWRQQRRTANVQFNSSDFRAFMARTVEELVRERLVPVLREACESGGAIDLQDVLLRFTFDNVCLVALGTDPGCLSVGGLKKVGFAQAFEDATAATMFRFLTPTCVWRLMKLLDLGPERELRVSLSAVNEFAEKAIVARKSRASPANTAADLLSAFMEVKDEAGSAVYSDKMLRDVSVNFILAGRDTSSVALSWFFWLVLRHPDVENRILAEIRSILNNRTDDSANFSLSELKQMHYLQAALSESLRLYPSVPVDHKEVETDDWFPDGTFLKKGTKVLYSIYSMGRMENIWGNDCLEFRPERWIDDKGIFVSESPFKYPVFNGGPRLCVGKDFAYLQMKWIAATVIWGFRLKLVPGQVVEPKLALTLYMKNGLLVTLQPRHEIHC